MTTSLKPNSRVPELLKAIGSNVADNRARFKKQCENYPRRETNGGIPNVLGGRPTIVLHQPAEDKRNIAKFIDASETFCVGAVNVTYECYLFYELVQEPSERFDMFLGEIRRLKTSGKFEAVEGSMILDRVVVSIKDDALFKIGKMTLNKATDVCKDVCEFA